MDPEGRGKPRDCGELYDVKTPATVSQFSSISSSPTVGQEELLLTLYGSNITCQGLGRHGENKAGSLVTSLSRTEWSSQSILTVSEPRQVKNFGQWEGENLTRECYGSCDWLVRDSGGLSDSALT